MTFPANFQRVWVRGRFIDLGLAAKSAPEIGLLGSVRFAPSASVLLDVATKQIIASSPFLATTDSRDGYFQVQLPATDDPDISPVGWTYAVLEPTGRQYNITVPYDTPALDDPSDSLHGERVIDLISIVPASAPSPGTVQLLSTAVQIGTVEGGSTADAWITGSAPDLTLNLRLPEGPEGPEGPLGPQGAPGVQGPVGPEGPAGPQGPQGLTGPEGPEGPQGPEGVRGPIGPEGPQGPQGPLGPEGPIGPEGPQGPMGEGIHLAGTVPTYAELPTGLTVEDTGTAYLNDADDLLYVWSGTAWPASGAGAPIRGPEGPQGPQGPVGPEGPQGPQGLQGETGPEGPVGPQGIQGQQGLTGPEGPEGPIGPEGPQGPAGQDAADIVTRSADGNAEITEQQLRIGPTSYPSDIPYPDSAYVILDRPEDIQDASIVFRTAGATTGEIGHTGDGNNTNFKVVTGTWGAESFEDSFKMLHPTGYLHVAKRVGIGAEPTTALQVHGGTTVWPVALTFATSVATNCQLSDQFRLTATGDFTLANPTGMVDGQKVIWEIYADGAEITVTPDTAFAFGSTITALTPTPAGTADFIGAIYSAWTGTWRVIAYSKGF